MGYQSPSSDFLVPLQKTRKRLERKLDLPMYSMYSMYIQEYTRTSTIYKSVSQSLFLFLSPSLDGDAWCKCPKYPCMYTCVLEMFQKQDPKTRTGGCIGLAHPVSSMYTYTEWLHLKKKQTFTFAPA